MRVSFKDRDREECFFLLWMSVCVFVCECVSVCVRVFLCVCEREKRKKRRDEKCRFVEYIGFIYFL